MNGATLTVQLQEGADSSRITQLIGLLPGVESVQSSQLVLEPDKPSPKRERPRNPLFDALAVLDCPNLSELTRSAASRVAKALQDIKAVAPDVTPAEIKRRADNYRAHMPGASLTSTALSAHWGRCAEPPVAPDRRLTTPHWKLIKDIEAKLETHPANPRWVGYVRGAATKEQEQDYQTLLRKRDELNWDRLQ